MQRLLKRITHKTITCSVTPLDERNENNRQDYLLWAGFQVTLQLSTSCVCKQIRGSIFKLTLCVRELRANNAYEIIKKISAFLSSYNKCTRCRIEICVCIVTHASVSAMPVENRFEAVVKIMSKLTRSFNFIYEKNYKN